MVRASDASARSSLGSVDRVSSINLCVESASIIPVLQLIPGGGGGHSTSQLDRGVPLGGGGGSKPDPVILRSAHEKYTLS